jgi:hypothetical protein
MPSIPSPPSGSQELAEYSVGDSVYYYRTGKPTILAESRTATSNIELTGKWRRGEVLSQEGSSAGSPRYLVGLILNTRVIRDHDLT